MGTPVARRSIAMHGVLHGVRRRRRRVEVGAYADRLEQRGREVLADEVGADRQLAVAAVDEHGELHRLRAGRRR